MPKELSRKPVRNGKIHKSPCDGCAFALWDITHDANGHMNGFADYGLCEHPITLEAIKPLPLVLYHYTKRADRIERSSFFPTTCETRKEEDTE